MIDLSTFLLVGIGGFFIIIFSWSKKFFSPTEQLLLALFFVLISLLSIVFSSVYLFLLIK
ncbi:hypothetical protein IGI50_001296 [Enterococcus sp. DIV0170]